MKGPQNNMGIRVMQCCFFLSHLSPFHLLFINSLIAIPDSLEPHLSQRRLFKGNKILWPKYLHEPCLQKEKENTFHC